MIKLTKSWIRPSRHGRKPKTGLKTTNTNSSRMTWHVCFKTFVFDWCFTGSSIVRRKRWLIVSIQWNPGLREECLVRTLSAKIRARKRRVIGSFWRALRSNHEQYKIPGEAPTSEGGDAYHPEKFTNERKYVRCPVRCRRIPGNRQDGWYCSLRAQPSWPQSGPRPNKIP